MALASLHEIMKELLVSDPKNISHGTFLPFDEFYELTIRMATHRK